MTAPAADPDPMDQPMPGETIAWLTDWDVTPAPAVELPGTLRMAIGGMSAEQIATVTGMDRPTLAAKQQRALDVQQRATHFGRPVHGDCGLYSDPTSS